MLILLVCLMPRQAWAGPGVIVVVRAVGAVDSTPYELRLRSELRTEGIDAVLLNVNATNSEPKALASRFGASGIIEVTLANEEATAWVWVSDSTLMLEITRSIKVNLTQRDAVAVFALRSVDLFVGAKLELEQQRRVRLPATAPVETAQAPDGTARAPIAVTASSKPNAEGSATKSLATAEEAVRKSADSQDHPSTGTKPTAHLRDGRFRVGGGVAMMQFTDTLQRRISATLAASVSLSENWSMGLTFSGPFVATILVNVRASEGHDAETNRATVDQEFGWLDGRYRWSLSQQFDLEPNLGLGVARYGVSGEGGSTYVGRDASAYSLMSSLGASLVWRVGPRVRLMTEVACLVRWQTPLVVVDNQNETGTSRLNYWGSFGPAWVF